MPADATEPGHHRDAAALDLGMFLRACTFGHVRQLDALAGLLARLTASVPLLPDADRQACLGIDDTVRSGSGYTKQAPEAATAG
ncbi:hypothetical protein [Pseudonocardia nigra]|uniref:hypothetical protein n=1 Tax=Pseudonocardia nigra TaxID=1921578 RepID=UPI001C5DAF31|nr:hypothetical protein [Pseudonocardia nigra]